MVDIFPRETGRRIDQADDQAQREVNLVQRGAPSAIPRRELRDQRIAHADGTAQSGRGLVYKLGWWCRAGPFQGRDGGATFVGQ